MAGGLDNLSADGLSQLSRTINEAKELIKRQEVLLRQTLEMEDRIASRRKAALKEYNDEYSKLLNNIASAQESLSAEMFKINEAGREAAGIAEKAAESAKQARDAGDASSRQSGARPVRQTVSSEAVSTLGDADSANWENFAEQHRARKDALLSEDQLKAAMAQREEKRLELRKAREKEAHDTTLKLLLEKEQAYGNSEDAKRARLSATKDAELASIQSAADAELSAQELRNQMRAEMSYTDENAVAAGEDRARAVNAANEERALQELRLQMDAERRELEFQAMQEHNGILREEDSAAIQQQIAEKYAGEEAIQKFIDDSNARRIKEESKRKEKEEKEFRKSEEERHKQLSRQSNQVIASATALNGFSSDNSVLDRIEKLRELRDTASEDGNVSKGTASLVVAVKALSSLAQQLETKMDEIASYKSAIDTRLHGSSNETRSGSYWDQLVRDMTRVGAINPYFKQETFANKIKELVDIGIAFDLEQRAFLGIISDKIATTFNVADSTLLRLIRIQQQDSTAGRLGMEAALNEFLNNMYENTEYLKTVATGVRNSLEEMQALMDGAAATEVEYQVQKWMGSLYSVGMSQEAVTRISTALGQIAAGQIEGLTGDGAGNLLIMAANDAGLSIADILAEGLDASNTNKLMQAVVNYLAEIAEVSQDNNVVQQQLANVFGVKASDLRAATNLSTKDSVGAIYSNVLSYDNMLGALYDMAGTMAKRTSLSEMMSNIWSNGQYTLAGSMASNPISYFIYKAATLLDDTTGGIALPALSIYGNMVDLETTVADLMRVASMSTGILGNLGTIVSGLGNSFSGQKMLTQLGISQGTGLTITPRGDGVLAADSINNLTLSDSGYIAGNASGSDVKNSTIQEAEDSKKQLMVEAQEEAESSQIDSINNTVLKIYGLLDDVAHGNSYLRVKVEGYGLTKASNTNSSLGGVNALDSLGTNDYLAGSIGSSLGGGGVNSGGASNSINLSGWTTTL